MADPIPIGDLHSNDRKKIAVEFEVSNNKEEENQVIGECTLEFEKTDSSSTTSTSSTERAVCSVCISFSQDETIIQLSPQNDTVFIAFTMQKIAVMDRELIKLLDKNDYDGAILLKQKCLDLLKDALPFDSDNSLPKVIARVNEVLTSLKSKNNRASVRKLVDFEACREEEDDDFGYACFSDSDEGCYSDENIDLDDPFDSDSDIDYDDCDDF